jgi:hypothetical protein
MARTGFPRSQPDLVRSSVHQAGKIDGVKSAVPFVVPSVKAGGKTPKRKGKGKFHFLSANSNTDIHFRTRASPLTLMMSLSHN